MRLSQCFIVLALAATTFATVQRSPGARSASDVVGPNDCPSRDKGGKRLLNSASPADHLVECDYEPSDGSNGACIYFTNAGLSSGGSDCPSITPSGQSTSTTASNPDVANQGSQGTAGSSSSSSGDVTPADCPERDLSGRPLLSSGNDTSFVFCDYDTAADGQCEYFVDGSFSSGGNNCPHSISGSGQSTSTTTAGQSTSTASSNPPDVNNQGSQGAPGSSSSSSGDVTPADCAERDLSGRPLLSSGNDTSFVFCDYDTSADGHCEYFVDGSFSSGGSNCPNSIHSSSQSTSTTTSSQATSTSASSNPDVANQSSITCPPSDKNGTLLLSSGQANDKDGSFLLCIYPAAGRCEYFANGEADSGSSTCPPITFPASAISGDLAVDASVPSSGGGNKTPSAALIALLVINGVLVLGILTLLVLFVRDRRAAAAAAPSRGRIGRYAKVGTDNAGDDVPFSLLSEGAYYDPHEKP